MIIFPVKIQKLLIGQIRNTGRVSAGFVSLGGIRIQRIENFSGQHIFW